MTLDVVGTVGYTRPMTTSTTHQAVALDGTVWFEADTIDNLRGAIAALYEVDTDDVKVSEAFVYVLDGESFVRSIWDHVVLEVGEEEVETL